MLLIAVIRWAVVLAIMPTLKTVVNYANMLVEPNG
jgi:hypothetical protein